MLRRVFAVAARAALAPRSAVRAFATADADMNWDEVSAMIATEEGKRELAILKRTFEEKLSKMAVPDVLAIDWKAQAAAGLDAKLLAEAKAALESIEFPEYESEELAIATAAFDKMQKAADAHVAKCQAEIARQGRLIAQYDKELKQLETVTADAVLADDPAMAAQIKAEIADGKW